MKEKLQKFCFDVLGDFVEPNCIMVYQNIEGEWQVEVTRGIYAPIKVIREEWKIKTQGTEFEGIPLYLPC